jgi:hypothetical protein
VRFNPVYPGRNDIGADIELHTYDSRADCTPHENRSYSNLPIIADWQIYITITIRHFFTGNPK